MPPHRTEISSLGEFGLINRIRDLVTIRVDDKHVSDQLLKGIADDAAVYKPSSGKVQLVTTDVLVEGIHFDLTFTSFKHLGWKSMVASLSDIAAMGGVPRYATIALILPSKISVEMIDEFYQGAVFAGKKYSCLIVGGDTATTLGNMAVSLTVIGEAEQDRVTYRNGAQPGDYLCVSGHLGASLAGLKILQREKNMYASAASPEKFTPSLNPYLPAIEKHLMPIPRLDLAHMLTHDVAVHAVIDISDGLASEVHHICASSDVGAEVYEHNLPVDAITQKIAHEFNDHPTTYLLFGGEEYELLFTIADDQFEKLEGLTNDVTVIGRITEKDKGITLVREQGEREPLPTGGWDHFQLKA